MAAATSNNIYEFKIALTRIKPPIWRRIQVAENISFWELHIAIQHAMGWSSCDYDYHLHEFNNGSINENNEKGVKISDYFSLSNNKATYVYDFGDYWEHTVVLEKILPAVDGVQYPKCIAGKRACPPEDCGGIGGYEVLLEIIANPSHEEYKGRMEWLEGEFADPEHFDPR